MHTSGLVFMILPILALRDPNGGQRQDIYLSKNRSNPRHRAKITRAVPKICDGVAQSSGMINTYLGTQTFWYFESRNQPWKDPLIVYINGAMGLSSILGLNSGMFPCHINNYGNGTRLNPYSWNNFANLLVLDAIGTGFAPKELGEEYNVRLMASSLVNALYQFLRVQPNLRNISMHIVSESYGAAIVLETARLILRNNTKNSEKISLKSVIAGSAMIDVHHQYPILPFLASSFGISLNSAKQCQDAILECRKDEKNCGVTMENCITKLGYPYHNAELNIYQLPGVKPLKSKYEDLSNLIFLAETFLNLDVVKNELGIPPSYSFNYFNPSIFIKAAKSKEYIKDHSVIIAKLKKSGIKVLYYGGDMDHLCNPIGYISTLEDHKAKVLKSVLSGAEMGSIVYTNSFAAIKFSNASHHVSMDQPKFLSEVITRWINELFI